MRTLAALALLLSLAACGTDDGRAADPPAGRPSPGIPPARGEVTTRGVAAVIDAGRPELCLGPVAESDPPQCDGIPLRGWDWSATHGDVQESGGVRWGRFAVTGTFDGSALTVTGAIPDAVYDPAARESPGMPGDSGSWKPGEQAAVQRKLEADPPPGALTVFSTPSTVVVDVVHDDGTLQRQVDEAYGAGRVTVRSMLLPAG